MKNLDGAHNGGRGVVQGNALTGCVRLPLRTSPIPMALNERGQSLGRWGVKRLAGHAPGVCVLFFKKKLPVASCWLPVVGRQ
jgi:hypothetical protein